MNLTQRNVFWILLPLPFVFLLIVYVYIQKYEIDIVNNPDFKIFTMSDRDVKGNTVATVKKQNGTLRFSYQLGNIYQYSYAGVQIEKKNNSFYSLENLKFLIKIVSKENIRFSIVVNQFIDNYSDTSKPNTIPVIMNSFEIKKGLNEFEIKASDINVIPDWWLTLNPQKANNVEIKTLNKVKTIWLFSHYSNPHNKIIDLQIDELKLQYDIVPFIYKYLFVTLFYYLAIILFIWKVKKMIVKYIFMPIEITKFKEKIPDAQAKILEYIGTQYQNPNLKLGDVAKEICLSEDMTSELLKKHTNLTFRQYLNQIRMEEAKRLLKVSSLQISEIAFKVGYNNIQHFNRVFKEFSNDSPKKYREKC